jgi:hypothetical protein
MSAIRQRGTAAMPFLLLRCPCSISVYRASIESTQFPTVELVDPGGCFQGVKNYNLHSPLHRDNRLATRISLVQILTHLDNRDRRLSREERRLILSLRHRRNLSLVRSRIHTLPHIKRLLRWQHQDLSMPPRATYPPFSLALTGPVPLVKVLCLAVATQPIQRPAHHPPHHLHPLLTNY